MSDYREELLKERLEKREIWISGEINEETFDYVSLAIAKLSDSTDDIKIFINSSGGSVSVGSSISDMIMGTHCKTTTVALGSAMSSGFLIFMSGSERICHPQSMFVAHIIKSANYYETISNIDSSAKALLNTCNIWSRLFAEQTGRLTDFKFWQDILTHSEDRWFDAQEALKLGIVHKIKEKQSTFYRPYEVPVYETEVTL